MNRIVLSLAVLALISPTTSAEEPSAASVKTVLENAKQMELYSLRPKFGDKKGFNGWQVLGKTTLEDEKVRKDLVAVFYKALAEDAAPAKCFNPRHGIRATHQGKTVDIVICFECYQARFIVKDQQTTETLSRLPEKTFNAILQKARVPLADKR